MQPFEIDLRTGAIRPVAETAALDPLSLTLDAQHRLLYFLDGGMLSEVTTAGRRGARTPQILAENVTAFAVGSGRSQLFAVSGNRLRLWQKDGFQVVAEDASGPCQVRPGGGGCLYQRSTTVNDEREFWYAAASPGSKPFPISKGRVVHACWSEDGGSVLFLREVPKNNVTLAEVHEVRPEEGVERCVSKTSQFATFAPNGNGSVFVGASRSKAQPNVILLLRSTGRELTLCEHYASHAADVRPVFSPDSRRVYFQSDREGKSAIYSVNVERLIEPTGDENK